MVCRFSDGELRTKSQKSINSSGKIDPEQLINSKIYQGSDISPLSKRIVPWNSDVQWKTYPGFAINSSQVTSHRSIGTILKVYVLNKKHLASLIKKSTLIYFFFTSKNHILRHSFSKQDHKPTFLYECVIKAT